MRRLSFRLLTFNILLLFLPVGSMLYLDTYERQLLEKQEKAMVQEGRIFSSALAGRNLEEEALRIMVNLSGRMESRIRVVDTEGLLLADSAIDSGVPVTIEEDPYSTRSTSVSLRGRDTFLYRITVLPYNRLRTIFRKLFFPPDPPIGSAEYYVGARTLMGPEITAALEGRYGAATRISTGGQRSVTLYSALPVAGSGGLVEGVVLVSRSTYRILGDLYRIRLDIVTILLYSIAAAIAISMLLSLTITRPLRRLRDRAEALLDSESDLRVDLKSGFPSLKRKDEIGDLGRSLAELWRRLEERIGAIDDFTSDTLHELKNPLASIRSAAEVSLSELAHSEESGELLPFLETILESGNRIDRLLGELREISKIDTRFGREGAEMIEPALFLADICESYRRNRVGIQHLELRFTDCSTEGSLLISGDHLRRLFCNILDNAFDFAEGEIKVTLEGGGSSGKSAAPGFFSITVEDDGPGIDPADSSRIFTRFFSGRRERGSHSGLGLAICRSIVSAYGGRLFFKPGPAGGACFVIELPGLQPS
jgi:two-component system, OmpR family, sensor histidine kinase ChvG